MNIVDGQKEKQTDRKKERERESYVNIKEGEKNCLKWQLASGLKLLCKALCGVQIQFQLRGLRAFYCAESGVRLVRV